MAKMTPIDMDAVEDVDFTPLPAGRYTAIVESELMKNGKNEPHNPYIAFTWLITGPNYMGRKIFQNCTLTEKSMWNLKATLKGLELPHNGKIEIEYDDASGVVTNPNAVGKVAYIDVSIDGRYNRVDNILPMSGEAPATPTSISAALALKPAGRLK